MRINTLILLAISLIAGTVNAVAGVKPEITLGDIENCAIAPDVSRLQRALETLPGRPKYERPEGTYSGPLPTLASPLPSWLQETLDRVSQAAIGRTDVFRVLHAARSRDGIRWDPAQMGVLVSDETFDYLKRMNKGDRLRSTMMFVMGHEISHYFQDVLAQERSIEFPLQSGNDNTKLEFYIGNALWHAQTDSLALLLMRKVGEPIDAAIANLDNFASESWASMSSTGFSRASKLGDVVAKLAEYRAKNNGGPEQAVAAVLDGVLRARTARMILDPAGAAVDNSRCYRQN